MRGRWTAVALTLGMSAVPALVSAQDRAVPRGGGSSGGGSSSSGERHGGGSHSSSGGGGSSASSSSGGDHSSPPTTAAERRHPRPGTGTGDRYYGGSRYGGSYYGSPYYYGRQYYYNAYDPFFYGTFGYSPFYYSGAYGYAPYYYRGRYRDSGSVRVIADPEQTRVYVDGYYAGIADDFDGIFQRLSIPPGRHEITLKLDGYRTHKFRVYVPVEQTIKIHHVMERGTGEATDEVVGEAEHRRDEERDRDEGRYGRDDDPPERDRGDDGEDERENAEAATVRLDLKPSDASVYVDGEFRGSGRRAETLRLSPGRHRIEVVRPGYRTVEREIDVRAGEDARVQIELTR